MIATVTLSPSLNPKTRPGSTEPLPSTIAASPITTTSRRPVSSMLVSTTLRRTLSEMPRKFTRATAIMNSSAAATVGTSTNTDR